MYATLCMVDFETVSWVECWVSAASIAREQSEMSYCTWFATAAYNTIFMLVPLLRK